MTLPTRSLRCLLLTALAILPSCVLVEYSQNLVDESTGRGNFVTQPASIGGIVGFIAGVPLDIAALPASYLVYRAQRDQDEEAIDPLSTLLFPSFVLWRTGVIVIGTPFDVLDLVFRRAWTTPPAKLQSDYDAELPAADESDR